MSNVLSYTFVTAAKRAGAATDPQCFVSYFSSHHPCVHDMNMKSERETGCGEEIVSLIFSKNYLSLNRI